MSIQESATESMSVLFTHHLTTTDRLPQPVLDELQNFGFALASAVQSGETALAFDFIEESLSSDVPSLFFNQTDAVIESRFTQRLDDLGISGQEILPTLMRLVRKHHHEQSIVE